MKKGKKIRYKRRLIIYSALIFVILFSITDYYFETFGLPEFAKLEIKERLKERGFDFEFDVLKCGVINGIVLTQPLLKDPQFSNNPIFSAKKMEIMLKPSWSGKYFIALDAFEIESGSLAIPFFPEYGLEGENDIINIEDFDAEISLNSKELEVRYFSGKLSPFRFTAAGSLKNVFLPFISSSDSSKNSKENNSSFSAIPTIISIPYSTRAQIYRKFLEIKNERVFNGRPELRFVFNIDTLDPNSSTMKADVKFPSFTFSGLMIKKIDTRLSYFKQKLVLDEMMIELFDIGKIELDGSLNVNTGKIDGNVKGKLSPSEIKEILKIFEYELPVTLKFSKEISFKMALNDFSLDSFQTNLAFEVNIPKATFKSVKMFNIQSELQLSDHKLSASKLTFYTLKNKVSGNFQYNIAAKCIDATIQSSGPPEYLAQMMEGNDQDMMNKILDRITFPDNNKNIEISADLHCSWDKDFFYFITGNMVMHSFKYFDTAFKSGDAKVTIDSNGILIIPMMTLVQDNALATMTMVYDDSKEMKYHVKSPDFKSEYKSKYRFLSEIRSSLPGKDVLKCIFPEWESGALDMSNKANMKASGVIDFGPLETTEEDLTDFKVEIFDSSCKWNGLPIENLKCDLIFKKLDMEIKNVNAKVYDGDLSLYYKTNFITEKGKITVNLKDAKFTPIAKHINWDLKDEKGEISVITDSDFEFDENGNLLMNGNGNVKIRNSNLWEVPIIKTFGKLTSQWIGDQWGVISNLDADFIFKKDHLFSDNIQTNGNVVALRSKGNYYWNSGDFEFLIKAEILNAILPYKIIAKVFDPITALLESRVTRKNGKTEWQKITLMEKMFKKEN